MTGLPEFLDAICATAPDGEKEMWFNETDRFQIAYAKALCTDCPHLEECLLYALKHPAATEFGIWGSTTPKERDGIRRRARRRRRSEVAA